MKMNPMHFFSLFILLFAIADIILIYFLYTQGNRSSVTFSLLGLLAVFLFYLAYVLSFGISISEKKLKKIEQSKNHLSYNSQDFTIDSPLTETKKVISWASVEAVFLNNRPPLEGEYHNFEYVVVLNSEPILKKYKNQSWYNVAFSGDEKIKKKLPIIYIRDDSNTGFNNFKEALKKNLTVDEDKLDIALKLKFGNKINESSDSITTMAFYKIFDKNNPFEDEALAKFRKESKNQKT